jgi:hypothetical protein
MRTALRRTLAAGALALAMVGGSATNAAAAEEFDKYALESVTADLSTTQAGAHPDTTIGIEINRDGNEPYALTKDIEVRLPAGVAGNPKAAPTCTPEQLGDEPDESACPFDTQVGVTRIRVIQPVPGVYNMPVYNMTTPKGMVARLGFIAAIAPAFVNVRLDPEDHTVIASAQGAPSGSGLTEARRGADHPQRGAARRSAPRRPRSRRARKTLHLEPDRVHSAAPGYGHRDLLPGTRKTAGEKRCVPADHRLQPARLQPERGAEDDDEPGIERHGTDL